MNWIGLEMLKQDRAKFFAMVLAVALAAFLTQNQASILVSFLGMSGSQIRDVREADVWVMDPATECFEQSRPLKDSAVDVVRSMPGIAWAVPLTKVDTTARTDADKLSTVTLLGIDEATRVGEPKMKMGDITSIYAVDQAVVDPGGYALLFPGLEMTLGRRVRVRDTWLTITGVSDASPSFTGFPVLHMSRATALKLNAGEPRAATFVLARLAPGAQADEVTAGIMKTTGWKALTAAEFRHASRSYYASQGVPSLFYITITIGLVVGVAFTAQTFIMFVKENSRAFTTLKVLGVTHGQLLRLMTSQALVIVFLGLSLGTALAAGVTEAARAVPFLRGLYVPWQVAVASCGALSVLTFLTAGYSFRKVMALEPADVFRA